jgi:hypothetical protein
MNTRTNRLTAALLVGLAAAGCFKPPATDSKPPEAGAGTNVNLATPPAPAVVKLTKPEDGKEVGQVEVLRGTAQNVPKDERVWVVIFQHEGAAYFPQEDPTDVRPDGGWSATAFFGNPAETKKLTFDVVVVTADKSAQDEFAKYLGEWKGKTNSPGLRKLPAGALERDRVSVTRNGNAGVK